MVQQRVVQSLVVGVLILALSAVLFLTMANTFETGLLQALRLNQLGFNHDPVDLVDPEVVSDLIAGVFWNKEEAKELMDEIRREAKSGLRDRYFLPKTYEHRLNNSHFNDVGWTNESQLEVYLFARLFMKKYGRRGKVVDVGCGSGFKLVKYLSHDFETVGIEAEPALSHLRETYPDQVWLDTGVPEETGPTQDLTDVIGQCELGINADVIEHIREPDAFLEFLKTLNCRHFVISTPKREVLARDGPPGNLHHVREWTFHEFVVYLESRGFEVVKSYNGAQQFFTQFHLIRTVELLKV